MKYISIAIDGPAGAGKSTLARQVAEKLDYAYVDTGAIYRTIGLFLQICGVSPKDTDGIARLIDEAAIRVEYDEAGAQHMFLNDQDVTAELRTPDLSDYASKISAQPLVREVLLDLQRNLAATRNVVMDGRDIGTVVLPQADVKIFLTASAQQRALRRFRELEERGQQVDFEKLRQEIVQRDYDDSHRATKKLRMRRSWPISASGTTGTCTGPWRRSNAPPTP